VEISSQSLKVSIGGSEVLSGRLVALVACDASTWTQVSSTCHHASAPAHFPCAFSLRGFPPACDTPSLLTAFHVSQDDDFVAVSLSKVSPGWWPSLLTGDPNVATASSPSSQPSPESATTTDAQPPPAVDANGVLVDISYRGQTQPTVRFPTPQFAAQGCGALVRWLAMRGDYKSALFKDSKAQETKARLAVRVHPDLEGLTCGDLLETIIKSERKRATRLRLTETQDRTEHRSNTQSQKLQVQPFERDDRNQLRVANQSHPSKQSVPNTRMSCMCMCLCVGKVS
jgi:hypothetical protein